MTVRASPNSSAICLEAAHDRSRDGQHTDDAADCFPVDVVIARNCGRRGDPLSRFLYLSLRFDTRRGDPYGAIRAVSSKINSKLACSIRRGTKCAIESLQAG